MDAPEVDPAPVDPAVEVDCAPEPGPMCPGPSAVSGEPCTRRPQLILVIPGDKSERYFRGHAFGELLHAADDLTLARLALFDVSCATVAEIEAMIGRPLKGEPWMVRIDQTGRTRLVEPLTSPELQADSQREQPMVEARIDERIALLSRLVERAAALDVIRRVAAAEEPAIPAHLKGELDMVLEDAVAPRLGLAEAATATLLSRVLAPTGPDDWNFSRLRDAIVPRLAELTRERLLRTRPPAGARWARSGGCGVRIEGHPQRFGIGCGMGHVPERSRRFLAWLSDYERGF